MDLGCQKLNTQKLEDESSIAQFLNSAYTTGAIQFSCYYKKSIV